MPRSERPLDPDEGAVARFAVELRRLRGKAGSPPYRSMARRAHYSAGTLSDAAGGRKLPSLAVALAYVRACDGDAGDWEGRWHAIAAELAAQSAEPAGEDTADATGGPRPLSPYVGLRAFQAEDAGRFFGRQEITEELIRRLGENRFLAVFGASGAGKSSVLRAGLIARLRTPDAGRPGAAAVVLFSPGTHPIEECALALARLTGAAPTALRAELRADPAALHLRIRQSLVEEDGDVVLVVDQFEEVFTACADPAEREGFIAALIEASSAPTSRTRVVLGVRTDFYTHCAGHPALVKALHDAQVLIGPMTTDQLRTAIVQPAQDAGFVLEGALLATVMAEAAGRPGVLPLVSHALLETWRRRHGTALTLVGYQAAGGVTHAIAQTAEAVYGELDDAEQDAARELFLRLTVFGEGTEDTGRRIHRREVDTTVPGLATALERFVRARLVAVDTDTVEITHEALIRCWPRLREWLSADRDGLRTHRRLTEAVETWESLGRDPDSLYRGTRLAITTDWVANGHRCALTAAERTFLNASVAAESLARSATVRRNRQLRWLAAGLAILLVVSGVSTVLSAQQRALADTARQVALSRQLAAESSTALDTQDAMALAIAAFRQAPTVEARSALLSAQAQYPVTRLTGPDSRIDDVAFSPVGTTLAVATGGGNVEIWNTVRRTMITTLAYSVPSPVIADVAFNAVAFSPDGRLLAAISRGGTVTVWNAVDWRVVDVLGSRVRALSTAFSPDGGQLAVGYLDGSTRMWDLKGHQWLRSIAGPAGGVVSLAFSPDGELLAEADGSGVARVWRTTTGTLVRSLATPSGRNTGIAVDPTGRFLATANNDGAATLWDLATGAPEATLVSDAIGQSKMSQDLRHGLAFSPNGQTLVTTGQDGIKLWDVADHALLTTLANRWGTLGGGAAFSPDSNTLAVPSGDGVTLWNMAGPTMIAHPAAAVSTVAFSPDGRIIASGNDNGAVALWNPRTRTTIGTPRQQAGQVLTVAFSPDGRLIATSSDAGPVTVQDVSTHALVGRLSPAGTTVGGEGRLAFSPDGTLLAVSDSVSDSSGTGARVWNVATRRPVASLAADDHQVVLDVAFSPDGKIVATAGANGDVTLWKIANSTIEAQFASSSSPVWQVAYSPTEPVMASAADDGITLWDTRRHSELPPLSGHTGGVRAVAFSPDGATIATADTDGDIRLWNVDTRTLIATLSGYTGTITTLAFSPDGQSLVSGGTDDTIRLWELNPNQIISQLCTNLGPAAPPHWAQVAPATPYRGVCGH